MKPADFWASVDRSDPDGCWEWQGKRTPAGYGSVYLGHSKTEGAHRIAYSLEHGPIPRGMVIRHVCDYPPCVNPAHLLLGTYSDNVADARVRDRWKPKQQQSHCRAGHEFTPENTYERTYTKRGKPYRHRYCRQCRADRKARI